MESFKNGNNGRTLLQMEASLPVKMLVSAAGMIVLILIVYFFNVPNPNMILIAGLVFCSALFGFGGGITAAVIMFLYTLFFFSTDHTFTQFTYENMQKVVVTLIGITADMLFVCLLKQSEVQAFREVDALTEKLRHENVLLKDMSLTDALTGIRNRFALRQDYTSYQNLDVTVMMLDLNGFKQINDTRGHDEGDRVLKETGQLLAATFSDKHCYRYGGDEFVVIVPDLTEEQFNTKIQDMMKSRPTITVNGDPTPVGYAIGTAHARLDDIHVLRDLIKQADEKMYQAKRQ